MSERDELDERISRAMQARTAPAGRRDLAMRAMGRAREREAAASAWYARLAVWNQRNWLLNLAVVLIVGGAAAVILWRTGVGYEGVTDAVVTQMDVADEVDDGEEWLSDEMVTSLICGGLLLGALLYMVIEPAMGRSELESPAGHSRRVRLARM